MEKELDDNKGGILNAGDAPGLGGVCSMEPCSCHSSPVISLFLSIFLLIPKRLMETEETFGMALFSLLSLDLKVSLLAVHIPRKQATESPASSGSVLQRLSLQPTAESCGLRLGWHPACT